MIADKEFLLYTKSIIKNYSRWLTNKQKDMKSLKNWLNKKEKNCNLLKMGYNAK